MATILPTACYQCYDAQFTEVGRQRQRKGGPYLEVSAVGGRYLVFRARPGARTDPVTTREVGSTPEAAGIFSGNEQLRVQQISEKKRVESQTRAGEYGDRA